MRFLTLCFAMIAILFAETANAQMGGYMNTDSLQLVSLEGYAIVDSGFTYPMYYLDENNDGTAEYFLNFGPYWYHPDSSNATRPEDGEYITVTGGLLDSTMMSIPAVIVYEINGEFWRDPYDPFWNHMGHHGISGGHNMDSCYNSGFGWEHDPPQPISMNGTALLDSTYMMIHYYLDENNDGQPEYFLNFGPPWYEPTSGAHRPENGEQISIEGGLIDNGSFPVIIVYEINGLTWRDSSYFGNHMSSQWIQRNMSLPVRVNTMFDEMDWVQMSPGWWGGGGGPHGGMSDSLFCQILETYPGSISTIGSENAFAGYEFDFYSQGMMGGGMHNMMGCGDYMQFNSSADFQLHYSDAQFASANIAEQSIQVKYWDSDLSQWTTVNNFDLDLSANTISFSASTVANFYILTGDAPTGFSDDNQSVISGYSLNQNFPNPYNPVTTISYAIPTAELVRLKIFNIIGQEIKTLVDEIQPAGSYSVSFNESSLPSGVYLYKLQAGSFTETRKMILMK